MIIKIDNNQHPRYRRIRKLHINPRQALEIIPKVRDSERVSHRQQPRVIHQLLNDGVPSAEFDARELDRACYRHGRVACGVIELAGIGDAGCVEGFYAGEGGLVVVMILEGHETIRRIHSPPSPLPLL